MEGEQRVKVEDEEAIIIATADTQLIAETTASMETEESLELHQDDSVRDPSFNEGNFMSHNLLTSASTPICPASAMKRLLHLSNDSSEDNRTPPKKLRTELISKEAVQEPIQDGGSDSWKSHDGRLHPPSDAHLKGGSFSLDTGADDAHHRKSDSFSPDDNGAAAASSYDSHQGHIYRTGMSSDRLLDLRKSPTKEQLVHMIENLNRKIARYETGQEDQTCPSQHKNELMENTGKKLTFAINAICVVEMKDENSAHIRSVRLCEEAHPWPLSTYLGAGSFQHSGSDADRSGSAGSSSQVSGPGPFDVPPLTHAAKMAAVLHDSSSSSTNDGARAPHQGPLGARLHVKLRPQQLRLACPRCEYAFARPNQPANHSQPSSNAGSPLAGQSQLRDISNLATPPTAIKVSVSDSESLTKRSRPLLKRICKTDSDSMTLKHSAAGDILRSTPELIEPQQTLVDQNRRSSEGVADSLASDSRIRIHALQSLDNERKLTTSKEGTMTPDTSLAAKESTLTSNTSLVAKESTWTSNSSLIAKESILTSNTSLVAKDSTLTSNTSLAAKESTMITDMSQLAKESTLTSNTPLVANESTLTSNTPLVANESTLTSNTSLVAKESTLTSRTSPVATESTLISNTSLVAKESTLTSDASQLAKESTLTSNTSLVAKESTMTPSKPVATKKSPVTPSTSWGGKGIGTPYLNLDTSSMSTDSDAESSIFPSIFDDPGIESPFLDMETCHVTHLDMDSDAESEKQLRLTDELPLSKSRKMVVSPSRQYQLEIELIKQGPIPEAGTNLFKGCAVLFSQCKRHIDAWRTLRASDTEDSERELRTPADNFSPMHVHRLTRQVLAGGGEVYKRLHQVPKHMKDNLYLISDGPSRSPLYLSCIMLGVPLVSYTAVITACIERQNFKQLVEKHRDLFYLPVGWSDETGRKVMRKSVQEPLAGIRVGYECQPHGGNHVTHTFWREILARMGAHVFEPPTQQRLDFVVRNAPPDDQNAPAGVQNAPFVNCNWIVHSLLHASCRPADASPLYNVEFYH